MKNMTLKDAEIISSQSTDRSILVRVSVLLLHIGNVRKEEETCSKLRCWFMVYPSPNGGESDNSTYAYALHCPRVTAARDMRHVSVNPVVAHSSSTI